MFVPVLALISGATIAAQAGINAMLGQLLKSALLATSIAYASGLVVALLVTWLLQDSYPSQQTVRNIPVYLWFSGGLLGVFSLVIFYWLIPKAGIAAVIPYVLIGQLIFSMLAGHFGWFQLPVTPMSMTKAIGCLALLAGIIMINWGDAWIQSR